MPDGVIRGGRRWTLRSRASLHIIPMIRPVLDQTHPRIPGGDHERSATERQMMPLEAEQLLGVLATDCVALTRR